MRYLYRCPEKHEQLTLEFPAGEAPETADRCVMCGEPLRRVYTPPGLIFIGDGWGGKP